MTEPLASGSRPVTEDAVAPVFLRQLAAWASAKLAPPPALLDEARLALLDSLACLFAGRDQPQTRRALAAMLAAGALGPAHCVAGAQLSVPAAALVNGTAMHALDFDDYEVPGSTHPSAPLLGALLALAESRAVRMHQLLVAWLVGYETICRTGEALGYGHYMAGWHATSTIGTLGAAAAAARLLGLPAPAFANAVAIATSMAAGLKSQFGTDVKALHAGLAARAGAESALLAGAGIEAEQGVIEADSGFLARYGAKSSPGFVVPASALGRRWALEQYPVLRKPWPCCAYTHRSLEAAEMLGSAPGFDANAVVEGVIRVPAPYARVAGIEQPRTASEARFSLRYCVAAMLLDGRVGTASFDEDALARIAASSLMSRLRVEAYEAGDDISDMSPAAPDTLCLRLADGSERQHTVAEVRGGMTRPLAARDIIAKYLACGGPQALVEVVLRADDAALFRLAGHLPAPST